MSNALALVELLLVFALVLGAGVWELRKVRRDTRAAERAAPPPSDPLIPDHSRAAEPATGAKNGDGAGSKWRRRR